MSRAVAMILGAALVCAMSAQAVADRGALERARRHYQALEYDQALVEIAEAKRISPSGVEVAEALVLEGLIDVALNRVDEAVAVFREALRRSDASHPGPGSSPKILAVFERARQEEAKRRSLRGAAQIALESPSLPEVAMRAIDIGARVQHPYAGLRGQLRVTTTDGDIVVILPLNVDPRGLWTTRIPAEVATPGRRLTLRAELTDDGELLRTDPPQGQPARAITIAAASAALHVESPLRGAEVTVDGVSIGRTPLPTLVPVSPGRLRVRLQHHASHVEQVLEVHEGEIAPLTLNVDLRTSRVAILRASLLALGGVALVTGGALIGRAQVLTDRVESAAGMREFPSNLPTTDFSLVEADARSAPQLSVGGVACIAVGGALALTGALLFIPPKRVEARTHRAASQLGPYAGAVF